MQLNEKYRRGLPWVGALLTGLLLAASFPPLGWKDAAWVALVPLLLALRGLPPGRAEKVTYAAGAVFWILSISWIKYVTVPGWIGLGLYCALYIVPFGTVAAWWLQAFGADRALPNIGLMFVLTAVWVGFEYLRGILFTGFAWNALGVSQYRNTAIIQAAAWGGAYAVTAMIVWVNAAVALTLMRYIERRGRWGHRAHPEILLGLLVAIFAAVQGVRSLRATESPTQTLRVALIQPRTPLPDFYIPERYPSIRESLGRLTGAAVRAGRPDLVIWPETAIPDELKTSVESYDLVYGLATSGVPLLVGSMDTGWEDAGPLFYNSSFLIDTNGVAVQGYDKRHLVIFGEYVPLRHVFPLLKAVTPIQESFSPGSTSTVFVLSSPPIRFSVLICFEDTVAPLARESVRNGARLLINQTNDGWFDEYTEPWQHMMQCVFRCVENGVLAVLAANTGVSCVIDRRGRLIDVLDDGAGRTFIEGFRTAPIEVPGPDMPLTFYTVHGDLFARSAAVVGVGVFLLAVLRNRRARRLLRALP